MGRQIETLTRLGQGQLVRLSFEDGSTVEGRVNQMVFEPGGRLRLEMTTDGEGDSDRYHVRSDFEGGSWTPVEVRRYDRKAGSWRSLPGLDEVVPRETFRTMKSADMEAQEETGTRG